MSAPVPLINVSLADAVMEDIRTHPELHDQDVWARRTECGTVGCLAWRAIALSPVDVSPCFGSKDSGGNSFYVRYYGEVQAIPKLAEQLLELPECTTASHTWMVRGCADLLFSASNDVEDLQARIDELKAGRHICGIGDPS